MRNDTVATMISIGRQRQGRTAAVLASIGFVVALCFVLVSANCRDSRVTGISSKDYLTTLGFTGIWIYPGSPSDQWDSFLSFDRYSDKSRIVPAELKLESTAGSSGIFELTIAENNIKGDWKYDGDFVHLFLTSINGKLAHWPPDPEELWFRIPRFVDDPFTVRSITGKANSILEGMGVLTNKGDERLWSDGRGGTLKPSRTSIRQ